MLNPVRPVNDAHYYLYPSGEPFHEIECSSKEGMRKTTIRDAKKHGAVPSVTTILKVISKEALNAWKTNQAILSALTHPNPDKLKADDLAKLIAEESKREADLAKIKGKQIHAAIEQGLRTGTWVGDIANGFAAFASEHGMKAMETEKSFATKDYGGTVDFCGIFRDKICIVDFKTHEKDEAPFYDDWAYQLEAYARPYLNVEQIVSLAIHRENPGQIDFKIWNNRDEAWQVFQAAMKIWQIQNKWGL